MTSWSSNLLDLRDAIFQGSWGRCVSTIETIFIPIPMQALKIGSHQVLLSQFKYSNNVSDLAWLAQFSNVLVEASSQVEVEGGIPTLPNEVGLDYSDGVAGLTNLVIAIEGIWNAVRNVNDAPKCGSLVAHAIDEIITADLCHYWANTHPKEWQLRILFWAADTTPEGTKILPESVDREALAKGVNFALDPEAIGYKAAKWLSIADEIGEQLSE